MAMPRLSGLVLLALLPVLPRPPALPTGDDDWADEELVLLEAGCGAHLPPNPLTERQSH